MLLRRGGFQRTWSAFCLVSLGALASTVSCTDGSDADSSNGGEPGSGGKPSGSGGRPSGAGGEGGSSSVGRASGGSAGEVNSPSGGADPSGGANTGGTANPTIYVNTAEDLTDESEVDYADNEHGVITGNRLKRWVSDWKKNRPAAIEGRLVIFQVVPSNVTSAFNLPSKEEDGVFTYLVGANTFNVKRDNGYSAFETDIPSGEDADKFFKRFAIDPRKDLVVLTFEQQPSTQNSIVHSIGRAWLFLKYWGIDPEHLAILNGSLNWNATAYGFQLSPLANHTFSDPPNDGTVSVKDLGVDNTAIAISLEEIVDVLESRRDDPDEEDGVRIVDARGGAESLGLKKATSTGLTTCTSYTGSDAFTRCSTPFEGRIKGAQSVPWSQFLDTSPNGFRFLPKLAIKSLFDAQSGWNEASSLTIQYCRTNQRSTVTGLVANTILGYPTRLYEASFIEWGYSSAGPDPDGLGGAGNQGEAPNKSILPENSPFRTDLPYLTEHAVLHPDDAAAYVPGGALGALTQPVTWVEGPNYNDEADVPPPVDGTWPPLDPDATTTRLTIDQDRAYLRGIPVDELED